MKRSIVLALLLITPLAVANVYELPLNSGDSSLIMWRQPGADPIAPQFQIDSQTGVEVLHQPLFAGWNYIDIYPTTPIDMTAPGARLQLQGRYHQETIMSDPPRIAYGDASFAVYLRDVTGKFEGLPWAPQFGTLGGDVWYQYDKVIAENLGNWPGPNAEFDLSQVNRITIYSTNWSGDPARDFLNFSNLVITPEPTSLSLLALGLLGFLRRR